MVNPEEEAAWLPARGETPAARFRPTAAHQLGSGWGEEFASKKSLRADMIR